jgi:hypothetical protein
LINERHFLHARITVKNIGASDVELLQEGTWLSVSELKDEQHSKTVYAAWRSLGKFEILDQHAWIEPGETVSDDLLLYFEVKQPLTTLFDGRLVWRWSKGMHNIVVSARKVLPIESRIDGTEIKTKCKADGQEELESDE